MKNVDMQQCLVRQLWSSDAYSDVPFVQHMATLTRVTSMPLPVDDNFLIKYLQSLNFYVADVGNDK